jgi:hypothetical protein
VIGEIGFVPVVLCCPYHGRPLGQFEDSYRALISSEHKASAESQRYAQDYLTRTDWYVRCLRGVDLSERRLDPFLTLERPVMDALPQLQLQRMLEKAQVTYESGGGK